MKNNMSPSNDALSKIANTQQQKASNPNKSVWVGASAGTGKTKVLSDRVLRLLLSGVNPSKILCLTYTKAAAVEMNSRIAKRLSKWVVMPEEELQKELVGLYGNIPQENKEIMCKARQLFAILLDTAGGIKIQTIHSFCQEILKRFPLEAKISPYFEVMDNRGSKEVIEQIKNKLIATIENNPQSEIAEAMRFLTSNVSEAKFADVISAIIKERNKLGQILQKKNKQELLEEQASILGISLFDNKADVIRDFENNLPVDKLKELLGAWGGSLGKKTDAEKATKLAQVLEVFDWNIYISIFLTADSNPQKVAATKAVLEKKPWVEEVFFAEAQRILECLGIIKAINVLQSTKAILLLADNLLCAYDYYKKTHAQMDFEDIIILTRKLLEDKSVASWVLFKLDGGIDNILIDEAQDTSPNQWEIIKSISEEFFAGSGVKQEKRTVFAVGDRKQSIYSFQGADPDKFDEMKEYFSGKSNDFEKINLEVSFRSTPAVLDIVNNVFANNLIKQGVGAKDEVINHIAFRQGEGGKVELWDIVEPEKEEKQTTWLPPADQKSNTSTSSFLAKKIAQRIKKMVEGKEILESQNRPIRYADFLILVRRRNAFAQEIIRQCKALDVNVSGIDRIKLLEQIAIQDLISLGEFLLFPEDDLSLAEVLKSPIFRLDDEDLFELCYKRESSLWRSLQKNQKYKNITQELKSLLSMTDYTRPFELYSYVLNELKGRYYFSQRMGLEAEDGLDEFMNLTLSFEQNNIASMQKFIDWIKEDDNEIKRELEQGQNDMVRLMTIHGSKGLQAPIVILPDTTTVPQCKKEAEILFYQDVFFYPSCGGDYEDVCLSIKNEQKEKTLEEYRRLMYVALTRAEDKMIFCGYVNSKKSPDNSWYNLFKNSIKEISTQNVAQKTWEYETKQTVSPKNAKNDESSLQAPATPDWINNQAPIESPLAKPLAPSRPEEDTTPKLSPLLVSENNKLYKKGIIIHKLLQFLPNIDVEKAYDIAQKFIVSQDANITQQEVQRMSREVCDLLENPKFGMVFGKDSKAEVPIMGMIEGKIISGQIDRLVVADKQVIAIDFKTNRPAAKDSESIPNIYRQQMRIYKQLLAKIYPDKEITTLILWTNTANMMEVK